MTKEQADGSTPEQAATELGESLPDCSHLDEDAEALEDPVHSGDALHQHEKHHPSGSSAG